MIFVQILFSVWALRLKVSLNKSVFACVSNLLVLLLNELRSYLDLLFFTIPVNVSFFLLESHFHWKGMMPGEVMNFHEINLI